MIPRYTLPQMGAIWEETSKYRYWNQIERYGFPVARVIPISQVRLLE